MFCFVQNAGKAKVQASDLSKGVCWILWKANLNPIMPTYNTLWLSSSSGKKFFTVKVRHSVRRRSYLTATGSLDTKIGPWVLKRCNTPDVLYLQGVFPTGFLNLIPACFRLKETAFPQSSHYWRFFWLPTIHWPPKTVIADLRKPFSWWNQLIWTPKRRK